VILFVNTASKCGNTPQYAPLEALHEKYGPQGLAVLGFPSNDFRAQEPGTDEEISTFCTQNYGVKFDMFSKIDVKGPTAAPLYQLLTTTVPVQKTSALQTGDITWNFDKFLVARDGTIVARFTPKTQPDSPEVIKAIETELAKPAPASNS
jgi:glutathione peroxidase